MIYCVSHMNIRRTSALDGTMCPRVRDLDRGSGSPRCIRYVLYRMYRIELLSVPSIRIETVSNFSTSSIRSTYMRVTLIALGLRTYFVLRAYCLYIHVCM
jgi:hypothetical protein